MTVPITSDLAGYASFWTPVVIGALVYAVSSLTLQFLTWRELRRQRG